MKRMALTLIFAAAVAATACLEKDTTSTIYLRKDGSLDWVIEERNVRSDESDEASRVAEEAAYVEEVSRGDRGPVNGLLALGAGDVRVQWLRTRRPYAVMIDARFDNLAGVFDRLLAPCGIPYDSSIAVAGGMATWTLRADVGIDGKRLTHEAIEDCGKDVDGLDDAFEELRIVLESGTFTAATGFTLEGAEAVAIDNDAISASVKTTGVVELSLSWR